MARRVATRPARRSAALRVRRHEGVSRDARAVRSRRSRSGAGPHRAVRGQRRDRRAVLSDGERRRRRRSRHASRCAFVVGRPRAHELPAPRHPRRSSRRRLRSRRPGVVREAGRISRAPAPKDEPAVGARTFPRAARHRRRGGMARRERARAD